MSRDFKLKVRFFFNFHCVHKDVLNIDKMSVRIIFPHKSKLTVG